MGIQIPHLDSDTSPGLRYRLGGSWVFYGMSQVALVVKEPTCQCRRLKRLRLDPWLGNIPQRRKWQPAPVFWLGASHAQRSLAGYSPLGHTESDTTEVTWPPRTHWCSISSVQFSSVTKSDLVTLSVRLFVTPMDCSTPGSLSITNFRSLYKLMSIESVMPSNHLTLCRPLLFPPSVFSGSGLFEWVSSLHQVAKGLEFQLQHQFFQWIFRTDFL